MTDLRAQTTAFPVQIHLVDGTYELFRCFFGAPPATAHGREVGAVRGLVETLLLLLRSDEVTHVGVAFDTVIESFRNELFDGYKTGAGIDPNLWAQFPLAEEATRALGLVTWSMIDFEADDALATAAARAATAPEVTRVLLCSPDKDLCQCVTGERVVLFDRRQKKLLDEAAVEAKFGVPPAAIPDLLALVGDAADGIPGIPGWGMKSAAALLSAYGSIEAIPDNPSSWSVKVRGADRLAAVLEASREQAQLYKLLATLRRDVPLAEDTAALAWQGPDEAALAVLADKLGQPRLGERVARLREGRAAAAANA
jgi:5'-3' exonuclease